MPMRQESQCAHDCAPAVSHPPMRSNSRSWVRNLGVAASIIAAVAAMDSETRPARACSTQTARDEIFRTRHVQRCERAAPRTRTNDQRPQPPPTQNPVKRKLEKKHAAE